MAGHVRRVSRALVIGALAVAATGCVDTQRSSSPPPSFQSTSTALESRDQSVTADDLRILRRAAEILRDESAWDRHDDRDCGEDDTTWSLFCALHEASIEVLGEYQHRRVALQEVRFAIEDVSGGEAFEHRLRDFNNTRTHAEVLEVLALAAERVESRLRGR